MTSKEDFQQAIRTGNINEAFLVAMSNAPELSITTKIITAKEEEITVDSPELAADNYLRTNINLIEGKIENEIGEKLTGDRYSEIKQFHMRQVAEGHETIQHNLVSLQKLFQLMSAFQQQQTTGTGSWVDMAANVTRESLPVSHSNPERLSGKTPSVLVEASQNSDRPTTNLAMGTANPEPQLPSFEEETEDEEVVNDLLSLADIDGEPEAEANEEKQGDWGEWLEEEPEVKSEVFDLKSLNIKDNKSWQSWNSESNPNSSENSQ